MKSTLLLLLSWLVIYFENPLPAVCRVLTNCGLVRQSALAATETMSGQAFVEKRGDGKDRHRGKNGGKNEGKKRVIIGETNVVPSRGHVVGRVF